MKYIIEFDDNPVGEGLYKAKGIDSLAFDKKILDKLTPYKTEQNQNVKLKNLEPGNNFELYGVEMELLDNFYESNINSNTHKTGSFCMFLNPVGCSNFSYTRDNRWESSHINYYLSIDYVYKLRCVLTPNIVLLPFARKYMEKEYNDKHNIEYMSLISESEAIKYYRYMKKRDRCFWTCSSDEASITYTYAVDQSKTAASDTFKSSDILKLLDINKEIADIIPVILLDPNTTVNKL